MAGALACTHAALPLANARRALGAPVSCLCRSLQLRTLELRPQKSGLSSAQRPRQRQSICRFCFIGSFKQILVSIPKDSRVLPMPSFRPHSSLFGTWFEGAAGGGARARSHQTGARRVRTRVTCGCASDMSPPHAAQRHSVDPFRCMEPSSVCSPSPLLAAAEAGDRDDDTLSSWLRRLEADGGDIM